MNRYEKLAATVFDGVSSIVARDFGRLFDAAIAPFKKSIESLPAPTVDAALLRTEAEKIVAEIPKPKDGEPGADGKSVTIEEVSPLVVEEVAKAVAQIPPAKDGQSVSPDEVRKMVEELVNAFVATVRLPIDGRDGVKGDPGKDAISIMPLSMIDETRSYPRGTYASHKGGFWHSVKTTDGMSGWEILVDGVTSIAAVQDPEDPRRIALGIKMASGKVVEEEMHVPFVIDKGVFKEGDPYKAGDGVTWARNFWVARKDTNEKPEAGEHWRLCERGGRDGKDGRDGIDKTAAVKL